jgi:hypothetical protein
MIEVRKPWRHEGFGCAKEGPLVPVWMTMKIDQLEPSNVEPVAFKSVTRLIDGDLILPENLDRWVSISGVAAEARTATLATEAHTEAILDVLMHFKPPVVPKIDIPPGHGFCRFIGSFLPKKFREQVLEAQLADAMQDYYDAWEAGDVARVKRIRYMVYFWAIQSVFRGTMPMILGMLKASTGISKD